MSDPIHYTAKDIERYHQGDMTAAEMHQLEKAALDDPLLADALEGYRYSQSASSEVAGLQRRLQQRITEEKKNNRVFWLQPWAQVAALFTLFAGGGLLVFQLLSSNETNLATSHPAADDNGMPYETVTADSALPALQQSPAFSIDSARTTDVAILKKENKPVPELEESATSSAPPTTMRLPADAGKHPATEAQPPNEVTANRMMTMKAEAPQATGRIRTDSLVERQAMAKRREVTDTEQRGAVAATESRASRFAVDSSAQPEGGWAAFEEYIVKNRKPVLPLNKKKSEPLAVELAFTIDEKGRPTNIAVLNSLNKESDEEAIRLLKEGPKWKGRNGSVRIPFTQ